MNVISVYLLVVIGYSCVLAQEDTFEIRAVALRSKCLVIASFSASDGAQVVLWPCASEEKYQWYAVRSKADPEYYNIYYKTAFNKCMSVTAASVANGATVVDWNCIDAANQQWKFVESVICPGILYIVGKQSGKCISYSNLQDGQGLVQWDCIEQYNQQFFMNHVGSGTGTSVIRTTERSI